MFTSSEYEIIIVDNSTRKQDLPYKNVKIFPQDQNIGHGNGLNLGTTKAKYPTTMFVDIDCHFLKRGWDRYFLEAFKDCDVLAGRGVPAKPIRPACMMLKTEIAQKYDWKATAGYKGHRIQPDGYDVAIQAYYNMLMDGVNIQFIESKPSLYKTLNGEDWCINDVPLIYHHWSGSWLKERQKDFPNDNLQDDKDKLFSRIIWRIP